MFSCESIFIEPYKRVIINTGIQIEIPIGFHGEIRPRSGIAFKNGITVLNSPGTIDSDYRGEIKVILYNSSKEEFKVNIGDRIAQLVITQNFKAEFLVNNALSETNRGQGGFGHTGI